MNTLIEDYLTKKSFKFNSEDYGSTLYGALREARHFGKRDLDSGVSTKDKYARRWLVAMGYLAILDQIGGAFQYTGSTKTTIGYKSDILKAIRNFGYDLLDYCEHKIHALVALRNSLFHNWCLVHIPVGKPASQIYKWQIHRFGLYGNSYGEVVTLPHEQWDGKLTPKHYDVNTLTYVNLLELGNLVEEIVRRIIKYNQEGKVELRMSESEFVHKYSYMTNSS